MKKTLIKKGVILLTLLAMIVPALALPVATFAQAGTPGDDYGTDLVGDINLPSQSNDLPGIVVNVINIILGFLTLIAIVIILIAGFEWMTAGGNDGKVETAQKRLRYGIIGLVIVFFAYAIVTFVLRTIVDVGTL
jgi:TRAP-type C4-dicarboxylate transport system permease small subunit